MSTDVVGRAIEAQDKLIREIASLGSCVIIGRAADYVLRDNAAILRVFIYAPEEIRIGRIMEMYGDTRADAARHLKRSNDARAAYYHRISGRKWGEKTNYDLILNSAIGLDGCVELICEQVRKLEKRLDIQ